MLREKQILDEMITYNSQGKEPHCKTWESSASFKYKRT